MPVLSKSVKKSKEGTQFIYENGMPATIPIEAKLSLDDINTIITLVESSFTKGISIGRKQKAKEFREFLEE
ncbi:hypothetical protein [Providencia rettgeri]|uniref:hypothetical protein n=1 Tax=Providencia rettgeri TaxID=587 RepID=UPI000CFEB9BE|nr:hypothetical protein CEQ08_18195 [Providencia rettgeri]